MYAWAKSINADKEHWIASLAATENALTNLFEWHEHETAELNETAFYALGQKDEQMKELLLRLKELEEVNAALNEDVERFHDLERLGGLTVEKAYPPDDWEYRSGHQPDSIMMASVQQERPAKLRAKKKGSEEAVVLASGAGEEVLSGGL